jgi:tRNA-Thr(GGU) m(6)t(6)A37 methyltransferase TsaA
MSTTCITNSPVRPVTVKPIGVVEANNRKVSDAMDYAAESRIVMLPEFLPALTGIECFSHLWVIYHQHCSADWRQAHGWGQERVMVHPAMDDRAGQGIFTSRAPVRPAALGSCIVEFKRREGPVLMVRGLDAIHGTPVLDVKVYVPQFDAFPEAGTPLHWAKVISHTDDLSRSARYFHWETTNVDFALGFRAGLITLEKLAVQRGNGLAAELTCGLFFAQGYEAATGCSPLRGTLSWVERSRRETPWRVCLTHGSSLVEVELAELNWRDAGEVMKAEESELLFTGRKKSTCRPEVPERNPPRRQPGKRLPTK